MQPYLAGDVLAIAEKELASASFLLQHMRAKLFYDVDEYGFASLEASSKKVAHPTYSGGIPNSR